MKCTGCGWLCDDEWHYCPICGEELHGACCCCGSDASPDDANHCVSCGAPFPSSCWSNDDHELETSMRESSSSGQTPSTRISTPQEKPSHE